MTDWRRRVLVVEDEPFISSLLVDLLSRAGFEVQAAADVQLARIALEDFDPDVAILDISLGEGPTGLDLGFVIHNQRPGVGILFVTQHPDPRTAGAHPAQLPPNAGFLRKSMIGDTGYLIAALEAVLSDDAANFRSDLASDRPLWMLTAAQLDVLRMAALGMTNAAIARERSTTERTVERILQAVVTALGIAASPDVNSRVEAVRRYIAAAGLPSSR